MSDRQPQQATTDCRRPLRFLRAWFCYHFLLALPLRWQTQRVLWLLLPHAGDWAYRDDVRELGLDPWGDRSGW